MRGPWQQAVHQRRYLHALFALLIALAEKLLFQRLRPLPVLVHRQRAVPQIRHLHRHLQREPDLRVRHGGPLLLCRHPLELFVSGNLHVELLNKVEVLAHVGGQHDVDGHVADPLAVLAGLLVRGGLHLVQKVELGPHEGFHGLAQGVVLDDRLVVKVHGHVVLLVHEEGIVDLWVAVVVHHGCQQAGKRQRGRPLGVLAVTPLCA
mmetsp:Transcript_2516/g.6224  ORF Transcript_2516/g.6224 Transcript_2516/m.6224 type:complete len:206 (+) Transcript_2516:2046-2663(+)